MIEVVRYNTDFKQDWDNLLAQSRIDTFLFRRDFMDYHSDRFIDNSFLIYRKGKLEAILPGNISNYIFYSHQGLTYGGLASTSKMNTKDILEVFNKVNSTLILLGVKEVVYKPSPLIYQLNPGQEDIYALFRLGAQKIGSNISSVIYQKKKIKFSELRKRGIRKAQKEGVIISESEDFNEYWKLLENNLKENYGAKPAHNIAEIQLLKSRFPEQIKLYVAKIENSIIGGSVLFIMKSLVHVQYISANETGKNTGALDLLFEVLINSIYIEIPIFDFGKSTEQLGYILNENLISQKEGFGARGIVYDIYKYSL